MNKVTNPIELYYQLHPEEENMGESARQFSLVNYLVNLLSWYLRFEKCFVIGDLIVSKNDLMLIPDIAVFKGVSVSEQEVDELLSWQINLQNRPHPAVVFEISSEGTWNKDIDPDEKPAKYGQLGAKEYFAYDPVGYWPNSAVKLRGWRYDNGNSIELQPDEQGRLWSIELDSWLVPDDSYLRLQDATGQIRLTEAGQKQAEATQKQAELDALLAKLRARGIDPDAL